MPYIICFCRPMDIGTSSIRNFVCSITSIEKPTYSLTCCSVQFLYLYLQQMLHVVLTKGSSQAHLPVVIPGCSDRPSLSSKRARGGTRNFPTGGLTLPTRELKYGFQGTVKAKNLRKEKLSTFRRGLACYDGGL